MSRKYQRSTGSSMFPVPQPSTEKFFNADNELTSATGRPTNADDRSRPTKTDNHQLIDSYIFLKNFCCDLNNSLMFTIFLYVCHFIFYVHYDVISLVQILYSMYNNPQ